MIDIFEKMNIKKIQKKVDDSVSLENKDYISKTLEYLDQEIAYVDNMLLEDSEILKRDIMDFSRLTTLQFIYNENSLMFVLNNNHAKEEQFVVRCQNGKPVIPKRTGFNGVYIYIVQKNEQLLNSIAERYNKIQPLLKHKKELVNKRDLVSGKSLFDMYVLEYNTNKEIKSELKEKVKNIKNIQSELFALTGWYHLEGKGENVIGNIDVDYNVINAIKLEKKWVPYSADEKKIIIEKDFINKNREILDKYKKEYHKLSLMNNKQDTIQNIIDVMIDKRNNIIDKTRRSQKYGFSKQMAK